jgi:diketogulonate reductase-like aldo/keto reductase
LQKALGVATDACDWKIKENAMNVVEANGAKIPAIGLGTMTLKEAVCVEAVKTALQLGYRNIDTAQNYGNEREVGEGIRASGVKREDVFLTTKIYWNRLNEFERAVDESLKALAFPSVDLLLIHWASPQIPLAQSVTTLCSFKRKGLARHVGVANFTTSMLDEAVKVASEPLVTNQIEVHPFLDQTKVLAACRKHGLSVTAYCPIARGKVPGNETLERIGKAHGKSSSQIALRYLVQQGIIPIPRTANPDHLAANLAIFDFALSAGEMAEIAKLKRPDGRVVNPPHAPKWDS